MVDFSKLGDRLLRAGAPMLNSMIQNAIGGIGGKIAGSLAESAIEGLAEALGTSPTPDAVVAKIDADPVGSATVIQQVEAQASDVMARIAEAHRDVMVSYHGVLNADAKQEGILSRLWRPVFAVQYGICFFIQIITACWLLWTRQLGTLTQLSDLTAYLIFMNLAACAVLGVQVYQMGKTERNQDR